ncbi:MAG: phosphate propanoyltransferase [Oscillospiraceae bacterium]
MSNKFIVETSARHLHVSQADLETLFGKGFELSNKKNLSQPGQFATNEKVMVIGAKGQLNMSILGPVRPETQIEVSLSDARTLGVVAPIRESGCIKESAPCKLVGPCGEIELNEGVIVAKRHIHMTKADAQNFNVNDKDIVFVKIDTADRKTVFGDVVVRVSDNYALAMHVDTDESNATHCQGEVFGEIVKL